MSYQCEFEDVFAKSEFDLVKFITIQHGIDTGTNRPVIQRTWGLREKKRPN